jgi:BTB/POZ domain
MESKRACIRENGSFSYEIIAADLGIATEQVEGTMRSLKSVLDKINTRAAELRAYEKKIEAMEEAMRVNRDKVASIIKMNLRGRRFTAYKDTLVKVPGTYFFGMLSSSLFQPDLEGEYFIDRYPEGFDRIIEYLKTGVLFLQGLNEYEVDCVYDNLDYFNIPHKRRWKFEEPTLIE